MMLITGSGRLAKELETLSSAGLSIKTLSRSQMDITNENEVFNVIGHHIKKVNSLKYLIHTAALTKPMDINDKKPMTSLTTNIVGTANVVKACHEHSIKLIYISTDFIYPPNETADETSPVNPSNNYGWSKLGGECAVRLMKNYLILRCALCDIPFRHPVAFDDVYRNSITHADVAKIIIQLKDQTGVINIGGKTQSVYDFVAQYQTIKKQSGGNIVPSINIKTQKLKSLLKEL
jgi:dTDP-4-dehydrorhamnose reductase